MTSNQLPYDCPIKTKPKNVLKDWIDYNGHMNVSYYSLAFDQALDEVFETVLGIGISHTKSVKQGPYVLQNNLHYLDEFLEGAEFRVNFQLIDYDSKRLHVFLEMTNANGKICATSEQLLMNVDLTKRRSAPYPEWVMQRLANLQKSHDQLPKPVQLGAGIGIRRKR